MYTVSFPNVVESFHYALNEVLTPFFTGESRVIMQDNTQLYKCDLFYSNQLFTGEPRPAPFVAFCGSRAGGRQTEKTTDPKGNRRYGYEIRQTVYRSVFAGIGATLRFNPPPYIDPANPRQATLRDAEAIWSQVVLVLENQYANLALRGIYRPVLAVIPAVVPSKDYFLLTAELQAEIRCTFTRGN